MSTNVISLLVLVAGWTIAAGLLKLVAKHCQRGVDAATAMNDASKVRMDAALAEMRAEADRFAAHRAAQDRVLRRNERLIALWAAVTGDPSSPEAVDARADAAERARWN